MEFKAMFSQRSFISRFSLGSKSKNDRVKTNVHPEMVFNLLSIKGTRLELESLRRMLEGFDPVIVSLRGKERHSIFCFSNIIEMPPSVLDTDSQIKLGCKRIEIWGTDSDAWGANLFKERENELIYSFTTKGIPEKVIDRLVSKYPSLKFSWNFRDDRVGLRGLALSRNGQLVNWNSC